MKIHRLILIVVSVISTSCLVGCRTTVPASDTTPPEVTMTIMGSGVNYSCSTTSCPPTPELSRLIYSDEALYIPDSCLGDREISILVAAGDSGDIHTIGLELVFGDYTITEITPDTAVNQDVEDIRKRIFVTESGSEPRSGALLLVKLTIPRTTNIYNVVHGPVVAGYALDYGGSLGRPNGANTTPIEVNRVLGE